MWAQFSEFKEDVHDGMIDNMKGIQDNVDALRVDCEPEAAPLGTGDSAKSLGRVDYNLPLAS